MPAEGSGALRKPTTRSSIRQSLGLVGKALVDTMTTESKDKKKAVATRRASSGVIPAHRASMDARSPPTLLKKDVVVEKTVTRAARRASTQLKAPPSSSDERATTPAEATSPPPATLPATRSATLRARPASSALPKYRPRSVALDSGRKAPSPARTSTRRRLSSSDEEKEKDGKSTKDSTELLSPNSDKSGRPISPIPHRAALKVNLTSAINVRPTTPVSKTAKSNTPTPKLSPARPTKISKPNGSIPRPSSSASSSSSRRTPSTPPQGSRTWGFKHTTKEPAGNPSPLRSSPFHRASVKSSPSSSRRVFVRSDSSTPTRDVAANMSHISEGTSEDSDDSYEDVAILLAPVASMAGPTPAMPRLQSRAKPRADPETPSRRGHNFLPTRADLSYISPLPPGDGSPSSGLRVPSRPVADRGRGSILSWEQLATESSVTLEQEEIDNMLYDVPAPFRSGAVSPTPSNAELMVPESPFLSAYPSPGGYGSISQVLLPEVTPSPAPNPNRFAAQQDGTPVGDGATVTLLRLQMASLENTARERLGQVQLMEDELHRLKEARTLEAEELTTQIDVLEEQLHGKMNQQLGDREERAAYTASLEAQLQQRDRDIEAARLATKQSQKERYHLADAAGRVGTRWDKVKCSAEAELDFVRGDMEVLAVLLASLEGHRARLAA